MSKNMLFVELGIDATNDNILDQMRTMKACREDGNYGHVVCTVRGFSEDKRDLFEIPEIRASRPHSIRRCLPSRKTPGVPPRCASAEKAGYESRCR